MDCQPDSFSPRGPAKLSRLRNNWDALCVGAVLKLHVLPSGLIQTNAYLLTDAATQEAVLMDAPAGVWGKVEPILAKEGCRLTQLWITHGHWDHMDGAAEVVRAANVPVVAHKADQPLLETPEVMEERVGRMMGMRLRLEAVKVTRWVDAGDRLPAFGMEVEVRHVPGHCPGNILFYFAEIQSAFVGDALFAGSVGRTDLPGGDSQTLLDSIRRDIYSLPDETKVYPGHGPATTVGREKKSNPYVRA